MVKQRGSITESLIPSQYQEPVRYFARRVGRTARPLRQIWYRGDVRYCPVCDTNVSRFHPFGKPPKPRRANARCPVCGSLERHRLLWLYLRECTDLFEPGTTRLLHIAPEFILAERLSRHESIDYLSADLESKLAMVRMDITDIQYPDESFDFILCSHVFEHVPNDRLGMSELQRVLRRGGSAIMQVPLRGDTTFEDPAIASPQEREHYFGQRDHVRRYGHDFKDRLEEAGFQVDSRDFAAQLGAEQVERMSLNRDDRLFHCRKP